ncbi:MAG TPA: PDZ domain-containing protein [Blastocatellia bacterium]|nr:PDZ domain-containing protein [Blastocatellia bacterium]
MNRRFLILCVAVLSISTFFIAWKTFASKAGANPTADTIAKEQSESQIAHKAPIEPDEIDEYMKSLQPPKSMIGLGGLPTFWIRNVLPDSPAAIAGLKAGDLILSVNGQGVKSAKVILNISLNDPGTLVTLDVVRFNPEKKEYETLQVTMPTAQWNPKSGEDQ